jgi:hypothetical protein
VSLLSLGHIFVLWSCLLGLKSLFGCWSGRPLWKSSALTKNIERAKTHRLILSALVKPLRAGEDAVPVSGHAIGPLVTKPVGVSWSALEDGEAPARPANTAATMTDPDKNMIWKMRGKIRVWEGQVGRSTLAGLDFMQVSAPSPTSSS